ncbi:hypothetical protein [Mucilaginibacter psychrotolerans]|uniref:Uncharacterized protein n=1 Tax=Mucilaginibacter psychrotolerans TaxID=1524096 RepID=A0A4Y8RYA6_9SPHI|nr:hypothetical protein [Mucilaginibacter psychrotolerans]TFF30395.1 hypothetical protein E2R66_27445 [Mucilaginibacter psychrotolerans]
MENKPVLDFEFDIELYEEEIRSKGFCDNVRVTLPNNLMYKVCFYDPVRLQQDIQDEHYIAIPGLLIVQEITLEGMKKLVYILFSSGYFNNLKPLN